jgi:hypothetical protein
MRTYLQSDTNNREQLISSSNTHNQSGLLKYSSSYTPNINTHLQYAFFAKLNTVESINTRNSIFPQSVNNISELDEQFSYSMEHQFMFYHTHKEKNIFSVEASVNHDMQNPNFTLLSDENPFPNLLMFNTDSSYRLLQDKQIGSENFKAEAKYYRILNNKNHVNFSGGFNISEQKMISGMQTVNNDMNQTMLNDGFKNDLSYQFNDYYSGVQFTSKLGSVTVKPGLYLHQYSWANDQNEIATAQNSNLWLPNFFARWEISSTQGLSLRYAKKAEFVDIQKYAEGIILTDYNALFGGNRLMENGIYHSVNLYYNYFNFFAGMNTYLNFTAVRKINDFGNQVRFEGVERINGVVNLDRANESFQSQLGVDKKFILFRVNGSANFSGFKNNSFVNGNLNVNQSFNQDYRGAVKTTVLKKLKMEMGYQIQHNSYESNQASNAFLNHKPFFKLDLNLFNSFDLATDYHYNNYTNKGNNTSSTFEIWNTSIRYQQKSKPWEFRLSGYNLINTKSVRRDSFDENLISTYEYFIQPRYFMLAVKYDL